MKSTLNEENKSTAHQCFSEIFQTALIPLNIDVKSEYSLEKNRLE